METKTVKFEIGKLLAVVITVVVVAVVAAVVFNNGRYFKGSTIGQCPVGYVYDDYKYLCCEVGTNVCIQPTSTENATTEATPIAKPTSTENATMEATPVVKPNTTENATMEATPIEGQNTVKYPTAEKAPIEDQNTVKYSTLTKISAQCINYADHPIYSETLGMCCVDNTATDCVQIVPN